MSLGLNGLVTATTVGLPTSAIQGPELVERSGVPTGLGLWCERVIEAGWLAALVVTPVLFNVNSSSTFELDKVSMLRSIALVMGLAWGIWGVETLLAGAGSGGLVRINFLAPRRLWRWATADLVASLAVLYFATQAVATLTSVALRLSLWGSYARVQGLYTTGAYLVIFLAILTFLRRPDQVERLLSTALAASLPVALYGIIQHFGTDPVPWMTDVSERVSSTLGNPIFVAAFLVMTVPLTLLRHLESARRIGAQQGAGIKAVLVGGSLLSLVLQIGAWQIGPTTGSQAALTTLAIWGVAAWVLGKPWLPFLRIGGYSVLLSTQLACLLFSQSRGPWLGLAAGLFSLGLLWTMTRGHWRWAVVLIGIGVAFVLALVLINLPTSPARFVRDLPYVGRLAGLGGATGQVRLLIWDGTAQLIAADPLRMVIGYGPEAMPLVSPRYLSPALGHVGERGAIADRAHNETFDALVTTGLLGAAVYLLLFTSLVVRVLCGMGVLRSGGQRHVFLGLWFAGGAAAVLAARVLDHSWRLVGVALPLGLLGGMSSYLSGSAFRGLLRRESAPVASADRPRHLMVASLLSAMVAHFVEVQFGIAVTATRTYFWTYLALLAVAGRAEVGRRATAEEVSGSDGGPRSATDASLDPGKRRRPAGVPELPCRGLVVASLLASFVLMTLVYDFLSRPVSPVHLPTILWLFAFTWVLAGLITVTEACALGGAGPRPPRVLRAGGLYAGVTLLGTVPFAAIHLGWSCWVTDPGYAPVPYYAVTLLVLGVIAGALLVAHRRPAHARASRAGVVAGGLAAASLGLLVAVNLDTVRANIYHRQSEISVDRQGEHERTVALIRRALALEPAQDFYHWFLGQTLAQAAPRETQPPARDALFQAADASFMTARRLSPLDLDHVVNLARLHRSWAQYTADVGQKTARFRDALTAYGEATAHSPGNVLLWNELGATYLEMGDHARALKTFQDSISLDDAFPPTYLHLGDAYLAQRSSTDAARAYEQAALRDPRFIDAHRALGAVYAQMGRLWDALLANERVLALAPDDLMSHLALAWLYQPMGQADRALAHAQRALALAPPQERMALERLVTELRARQTRPPTRR